MIAILGEMDVTCVNPYRSGQRQSPVHMAWFQPRLPTAVAQSRGRLEDCLLPGGQHLPGPDYRFVLYQEFSLVKLKKYIYIV